ncbi:MAG TPA: tRNA uridine-5-carboxymethylaminomethyl(34) synthesis GTPase MnmE [Micropepsaceae bacterium]|jgi:tRNA modification GTPase|nr:tRNA uridine-5-carboxymethylaminomethyl(34) synthesis GTPase MnmE [Micropepsaceae bacterium]
MIKETDTIFALASAPGRAGVAVVRLSGPGCDEAIRQLTRREPESERKAVLRTLFDPTSDDRIDDALVLRFAAPHSYTGEDVVEFQVHGGRAVQSALFCALAKRPGFRPAEPGEFTRRAVGNGCLDLTQAEAIADLVDAETESQRRQAFRQYEGQLAALYEDWRSRLIRSAAWIEAGIDFADEDIPENAVAASRTGLGRIAKEIRAHLDDGRRGEILRDGFRVAVVGPPNAGKSSLVNTLARRDVAIVSPVPGTTRDVIEIRMDLKGYPVILSDTAGLRVSEDSIEQEGIRRARAAAEQAELRLLVLDGSEPALPEPEREMGAWDRENTLVLWNKADLAPERIRPGLWVSATSGYGLSALIEALASRAAARLQQGEAPVLTRARHRMALEEAHSALIAALKREEPELAAEHVRLALRAIGRITGRVDLDELLDVVFRDFCIGK